MFFPNWSVAAEMQFYVLAILAVPLLARLDVRSLFVGGLLVAWGFRALAYWGTRDLGNPNTTFVYATQVPSMLDAFAIGTCIARLHLDGTIKRWAARHGALPLLATACGLVVALYFVWNSFWAHANRMRTAGTTPGWSFSGERRSR
jgi:peptidoglycan/LPS O-acetylase OafA/YrhL